MTARSSSSREVAANRGHACHGTTTTFPTPTTGTPAQLVAMLDAGERTGPPRGQEIARFDFIDRRIERPVGRLVGREKTAVFVHIMLVSRPPGEPMTPEQCRELWQIESGRVMGTKRGLIVRVAVLARAAKGAAPPGAAVRQRADAHAAVGPPGAD